VGDTTTTTTGMGLRKGTENRPFHLLKTNCPREERPTPYQGKINK